MAVTTTAPTGSSVLVASLYPSAINKFRLENRMGSWEQLISPPPFTNEDAEVSRGK